MEELRPEVLRMAQGMERRLREYDETRGRTGWKQCNMAQLVDHLREEVNELIDAVIDESGSVVVWAEAADIGNMAMMVADTYETQPRE